MDADECPMSVHATTMGCFFLSAHRLVHGGDEIVHAFERALVDSGVDVYCARAAVGVELDDARRVRGVRLADGDVLECQSCVCTVHPRLLADLLPPGSLRPAFLSRLKSLENTCGVVAVFAEVDEVPADLTAGNAYYLGDEDQPWRPEDALAAMMCGDGSEAGKRRGLCVLRPLTSPSAPRTCGHTRPPRDGAYEAFKSDETQKTVELFLEHYPRARARLRILDSATPSTFESYTGTVDGSAYGLKHSVHQWGLQARTPIKGLYLAGQSTVAPGLLGVLTSSLLAISRILGYETVWDEVRKCR